MYLFKLTSRGMIFVACLGIVSPVRILAADRPATRAATAVGDIRLQRNGELIGQVVNANGIPVADQTVAILRKGKLIRQAHTDAAGMFSAKVGAGVVQIVTKESSATYRVWAPRSAPPSATESILLVDGETVRGQHCRPQRGLGATMFGGAVTNVLSEPWVVSGLVAAAIAVPIATLDDDDDAS